MGLDPRPLGKTSEALCPLGAWPLGTQRRGLVLDRWPLGVPLKELRVKNLNFITLNS